MPATIERPAKRPIAPYSCGGCSHTWTGLSMCHCSGCHRTFAGLTGFDAHRLRGVCLDPSTRGDQHLDAAGIWRRPTPPDRPHPHARITR